MALCRLKALAVNLSQPESGSKRYLETDISLCEIFYASSGGVAQWL